MMPDREKVMSWLEGLAEDESMMFHSFSEVGNIARSALELLKEQDKTIKELQNAYGYLQKQFFEAQDKLLKEQEAVEPKKTAYQRVDHTIAYRYRCGMCDMSIFPSYKYCPFCGQAVKWE